MLSNLASHFAMNERWEVFGTDIEGARVEMREGRPPETDVRDVKGAGVRLIANNALGTSSCTGGDLPAAIREARRAAQCGRPAIIDFPAPQVLPAVRNFDSKVAALTTAELTEWLAEGFKASRLAGVSNVAATAQTQSICRRIVNHKGVCATHRSTILTVSIWANIGDGFEMLRESETSCRFDIDLGPILGRFLKRCRLCLGTASRPEKAMPAVLSEKAALSLVDLLEKTLVSVVNAPHTTLLDELRGQPLLRNDVRIVDAGAADWLPGSSPFDDEGVPRRLLNIIENGCLKSSIFDLRSARLKNEEPTGSAARRFDSAPAPQFSNPALQPGHDSEKDMLASLRDGLFIEQLKNIRLTSEGCFEFRAEIGAGFRVRNGRCAGPVRALNVAGNLFRLLGDDLVTMGTKARRLLRGSAPPIMVKEFYVCN